MERCACRQTKGKLEYMRPRTVTSIFKARGADATVAGVLWLPKIRIYRRCSAEGFRERYEPHASGKETR